MRCYALRDDQWDRIKDILPGREGHVGVTAKDNRLFVEAVIYRYRAGIPLAGLARTLWRPDQDTYALLALVQERGVEAAV
jgi:transposase